ncbi:GNAT family N-acetyltransferase [Streptacidiphilus fuscans]|uniref:GNAT family N-acetyltransferase n=1 Tax=Streptacidiphilus fuscans TaxID=2789292 RepID=A0A931B3B8_9ACTN|nr:GNAT family N-acetyltransferase [Streptacidiphilus fuscans]MBF9069594.1 GNAT family N-acetyltransferase [Streptacidiphilus fuscans]
MPTSLETRRMLLRPFTEADLDVLAALHGDPQVMRYIDTGLPVPREVVERETLPRIIREYRELPPGLGRFAAEERESGVFLGWFALRPADSVGLSGGIELGYRIRPDAWGQGFATEGARGLIRHAFLGLGLTEVVATTMAVNTASRRVLEKAGMSYVRSFVEDFPVPIEGAEHGDLEYVVRRSGWDRRTG